MKHVVKQWKKTHPQVIIFLGCMHTVASNGSSSGLLPGAYGDPSMEVGPFFVGETQQKPPDLNWVGYGWLLQAGFQDFQGELCCHKGPVRSLPLAACRILLPPRQLGSWELPSLKRNIGDFWITEFTIHHKRHRDASKLDLNLFNLDSKWDSDCGGEKH